MNVITPDVKDNFTVFLAGTIDNGEGKNWQQDTIETLSNFDLPYLTIFNPRRDSWAANASEEEVLKQIDWEQEHLEKADLIVMCILDESKSPISLMELGQWADSGKLVVFCTGKFWRHTNVKWMCDNYNIELHETNDVDSIVDYILHGYSTRNL